MHDCGNFLIHAFSQCDVLTLWNNIKMLLVEWVSLHFGHAFSQFYFYHQTILRIKLVKMVVRKFMLEPKTIKWHAIQLSHFLQINTASRFFHIINLFINDETSTTLYLKLDLLKSMVWNPIHLIFNCFDVSQYFIHWWPFCQCNKKHANDPFLNCILK